MKGALFHFEIQLPFYSSVHMLELNTIFTVEPVTVSRSFPMTALESAFQAHYTCKPQGLLVLSSLPKVCDSGSIYAEICENDCYLLR